MDGIDHTPQSPGQVNGSITPRLGSLQSGSSKRKSRPVKRIVQDEEDADDVGGGLAMASQPSDTLLESAHPLPAYNDDENLQREEDDTAASEVLSTGSDEASMDQPMNTLTNSDILRRFAEAIAANQAAQANSKNFNHGTSFEEAKKSGSPLTNGSAAAATSIASQIAQLSPLFPNTEVLQSSERLLQTVFNPSLSLGLSQNIQALVTSSHVNNILTTPLINQANQALFHTIMAAVKKQQESRPTTNGSKGTKRRLFSDDERARAEAAAKGEERIDMSDLEEFAQTFKKQRIKFGSFFEGRRKKKHAIWQALNLSFKNMCKLRPLLKEWLADIETAIESGATLTDLIERRVSSSTTSPSSEPTPIAMLEASSESSTPLPTPTSGSRSDPHMKRRRKRTNLDVNQRSALDSYFAINPRPDHDKMTDIANSLELERDVVRVWFCNRRQKMRRVDEPTDSETTSAPVTPLFAPLQHFTTLEQLKEATKLVCAKEPHDVIPTSEAVVMDES